MARKIEYYFRTTIDPPISTSQRNNNILNLPKSHIGVFLGVESIYAVIFEFRGVLPVKNVKKSFFDRKKLVFGKEKFFFTFFSEIFFLIFFCSNLTKFGDKKVLKQTFTGI